MGVGLIKEVEQSLGLDRDEVTVKMAEVTTRVIQAMARGGGPRKIKDDLGLVDDIRNTFTYSELVYVTCLFMLDKTTKAVAEGVFNQTVEDVRREQDEGGD